MDIQVLPLVINTDSNENTIDFLSKDGLFHVRININDDEDKYVEFLSLPEKLYNDKLKLVCLGNIEIHIPNVEKGRRYKLYVGGKTIDAKANSISFVMPNKGYIDKLYVSISNQKKKIESSKYKINLSFLKYAATILVLVSIFYILKNPGQQAGITGSRNEIDIKRQFINKNEDNNIPKKNIVKEKSILIAQNFEANNIYERYMKTTFRSEEMVKVILPKNSDTLTTPIMFKWEAKNKPIE